MTATQTALVISGIGMGVVFLVLGVFVILIKVMVVAFAEKPAPATSSEPGGERRQFDERQQYNEIKVMAGGSGVVEAPSEEDRPPAFVVGAITAALMSCLGPDARFRIASIRPAVDHGRSSPGGWALAGRLSQVAAREMFGFRRGV